MRLLIWKRAGTPRNTLMPMKWIAVPVFASMEPLVPENGSVAVTWY